MRNGSVPKVRLAFELVAVPGGVGNDHGIEADVGCLRVGDRDGVVRRAREVRAVEAPLVEQRGRAGGSNGEGGVRSGKDEQVRWVRDDQRGNRIGGLDPRDEVEG